MRTIPLRLFALAATIFTLVCVLLSTQRDAMAQKAQVIIGGGIAIQPDLEPKPPGEDNNPLFEKLSFPEDRDTSLKFEAVLDYLQRPNPDWTIVCKLAQGLLEAKSDYFYQYNANNPDPKADKRRVSVKDEISRLIGTFNKDGKDYYELSYGPTADSYLKDAMQNGLDRAKLSEISQRYFHTKAGAKATLLQANLDLEIGNFNEAAYGYLRLLRRPGTEDLLDARTLFKAALAFKRTPDGLIPEEFADIWDRIEKQMPRGGIAIGRRFLNVEQLKTEYNRPIDFLNGKLSDAYISMKGGNATRAGLNEAGTPFLDPIFNGPLLYNTQTAEQKAGEQWIKDGIGRAYSASKNAKKATPIPALFPVTAPNVIMYRSYDGIYAFYTKDGIDATGEPYHPGKLNWHSPAYASSQTIYAGEETTSRSERENMINSWNQYWSQAMPSVLFENSLLGSLSHDGRLVYFIDDIGVPPSPAMTDPNFGGFQPNIDTSGPRGMKDFNKLVAVDIETGRLSWTLGGLGNPAPLDDETKITESSVLCENAHFLGAPMPLNGKIYVLLERDGYLKLACLDPFKTTVGPRKPDQERAPPPTPELIWVQNLGRSSTPIASDPLRRVQASFLASADGVLVCPTNVGAVVAVDLNARSLLWAHTYATSETMPELGGGRPGIGRPIRPGINPNQSPNRLPQDRWRSAAPLIANSRVVMTAYDSDKIECLDLRSGKVLWTDPRRSEDLYIGGIINSKVIIVGKNYVRALDLMGEDAETKTPIQGWPEPLTIGTTCGHGVPSKDGLYFVPMIGDDVNPDSQVPQIWVINCATGTATSKTQFRPKETAQPNQFPQYSLGNLAFHNGLMYSQSALEISAFPLIEVKRREMDIALRKNPNDPVGLTARGELLLDDGKLNEAILDLKKAQANNPDDATTRKISQKLYLAYTEILRTNFEAGESFLKEYQTLCEFALDGEPGSAELARQRDEQIRRRGLYYSLIAKGREKQGRLLDAFDNYRAYAELGEKGRLLPVPEDSNTLARSDVWSSGRIAAMLKNAKDEQTRAPLRLKIENEWKAVREANDLKRLADFVNVYGPYFDLGREAQFLLAEKYLLTNNDDDRRQAELLLLNLIGLPAEDEDSTQFRAKALEALARLMTSRNLMEDAVGLYRQIGNNYTSMAIRDNKTGADIYADLVTDKRLLPHLEPMQTLAAKNYEVNGSSGNSGAQIFSQVIRPPGDVLPFFNRHRLSLDNNPNDGTLIFKVTDRVTGEDRSKFTGLPQLQSFTNGAPQNSADYPIIQACGHLVILNIGQFVYCYDLTAIRPNQSMVGQELWKVNLLGQNAPNTPPQIEKSNDGDTIFRSAEDGWAFRLGRSSVLQASYAAVLTRDGLVAMNPLTGVPIWTRVNVPSRSKVYGDENYIYLIETVGKASRAQVLRAVDGTVVDGIKDFGPLLSVDTELLEMYGRRLLRCEGKKDEPKVLRLYDVINAQDVWKKEFPANSITLNVLNPDYCGILTTDGKIEVVAISSGKTIFQGQIDENKKAEHLEEKGKFAVNKPLLLMDEERFFVFLNKAITDNNQFQGYQQLPHQLVNGACYAFDRNSGKRLWYSDTQFENQRVITEQFDEVPAIVAGNQVTDPNKNKTSFSVIVLDKQTGFIKYRKKDFPPNGPFMGLKQDYEKGTFEFWNYQVKVLITTKQDSK